MNLRLAKTAWKNISRNKRRSLLSGVAIGVAAMSIVMLFSLLAGMTQDMRNNLKSYYNGEIRIRHGRFSEYERFNPLHLMVDGGELLPVLDAFPGVEQVRPRITFPSSFYIEGSQFPAVGVGADWEREADSIDWESVVVKGRLPEKGQNEMLLGGLLAQDLGLKLGDKVTVMSTTGARGTNAITLEITGLASFPLGQMNTTYFWVALERAQYFLRMGEGVQEILITAEKGVSAQSLIPGITEAVKGGAAEEPEVSFWKDISTTYGLMAMAQTVYYFVAAFFFILGSTVIINTTIMVIFERMREIGTLSALGMRGSELTRIFFLEGTFISAIGGLAGVLAGVVFTLILSQVGIDFTDAMSGMEFEMSSVLYPRLNIVTVIFVYIYAVAIAALATFFPSRRAARILPVEALRYI